MIKKSRLKPQFQRRHCRGTTLFARLSPDHSCSVNAGIRSPYCLFRLSSHRCVSPCAADRPFTLRRLAGSHMHSYSSVHRSYLHSTAVKNLVNRLQIFFSNVFQYLLQLNCKCFQKAQLTGCASCRSHPASDCHSMVRTSQTRGFHRGGSLPSMVRWYPAPSPCIRPPLHG